MKGLQLLLQSMGIKINPSDIERAWEQGKDALPHIAKKFEEMEQRQGRLELKLDLLVNLFTAKEIEEAKERIHRVA